MRAALLTNILTPYRIPVYRALAQRPGARWRFFVNARTEFDRRWRAEADDLDVALVPGFAFRRDFAFGGRHARQRVTTHVPLGLLPALARFGPDVVVSAELGPRTLLAALYCAATGTPLVIWSYHSRASATAGAPLVALRRLLLARADAVIGMGRQARAVLQSLGVDDDRIFDAPNAHDRDGVDAALGTAQPEALRAQLCERGARERIALVVGRVVEGKGIGPLLEAWEALPETLRAGWSLVLLGDGPLVGRVRERAARRPRGEILHCPAVDAERVVDHYLAADLCVFPSLGDPWGLVVNEALACGLPVLCSSRAGCADELVRNGENGWVADPLDRAAWNAAFAEALAHPDLRRFRPAARRAVEPIGPESMADGISAAVRHALGRAAAAPRSARVLLERPPE